MSMLTRFCLYGFLKNQQYFDPFLILAFREKGLSFTTIGLLIGFREIAINLMEIPTGALADVLGRRRAMIASFLAYIGAFILFAGANQLGLLFAAMFLFAIGEAFRTGTHKAIIFDWLARQGRENEKTAVYGQTRSWSKLGSAISVVIAVALMLTIGNYSAVFLFCIFPYSINIINFLTYPKYLDGPRSAGAGLTGVMRTLFSALTASWRSRPLRRLLTESMVYEGLYKAGKDYLQPVLKSAALALPVLLTLEGRQRTAVLIGGVYLLLYLVSSVASRSADSFAKRSGGEDSAARTLWMLDILVFIAMGAGMIAGLWPVVIGGFILLAVLQNLWRPILISRVATHAARAQQATVLSIESQAKSLFVAATAPLLGWSVDAFCSDPNALLRFLPLALLGAIFATIMLLTKRRSH